MKSNRHLVEAFENLTDVQLKNLKHHLKVKTPICCGPANSGLFTDGAGGG